MTINSEQQTSFAATDGMPHYTKAETVIINVFKFSHDGYDSSMWYSPAPTFNWLCNMREPEFVWDECFANDFFVAIYILSAERRMSEGHKGLLNAAATTLAKRMIDVYVKACREVRVVIMAPYQNLDEIVDRIIWHVLHDGRTMLFFEMHQRFFALSTFSDPEQTCNNPLITTEKLLTNDLFGVLKMAVEEIYDPKKQSVKERFNRVMDIIAIYSRPKDRLPYRELERQLTIHLRVIYALEAGQMDT